jgi:hypothetical protein
MRLPGYLTLNGRAIRFVAIAGPIFYEDRDSRLALQGGRE